MEVRELMTAPVRTVFKDDTLSCAVKMMRDHAVGCVPVVDEAGVLVGVLTDRDVTLAAYEVGEALWKLPVEQYMSRTVRTCVPDDRIEHAARTMRQYRVRRLPVVDGQGHPIGILSLDDLVHASRQPILEPTPGLTADELDDTFDAVSGRSKHPRPDAHR
jgi:CBS domain-containing protein